MSVTGGAIFSTGGATAPPVNMLDEALVFSTEARYKTLTRPMPWKLGNIRDVNGGNPDELPPHGDAFLMTQRSA